MVASARWLFNVLVIDTGCPTTYYDDDCVPVALAV